MVKMSVSLPSETAGSNEIISATLRNLRFAKIPDVVVIFRFTINYKAIIQAYVSSLVLLSDISPTKFELE